MKTYKEKGYLLQTYALCQKEYTYKIFMCNDPSPKTYLAKSMLLIHARVVASFYTVE